MGGKPRARPVSQLSVLTPILKLDSDELATLIADALAVSAGALAAMKTSAEDCQCCSCRRY